MTRSPRPAALPGFSSPAAGFDEPLEMLHTCHDRVRRTLDLLGRLCERVEQGRIDTAVKDAARDVLHYFDRAAPHHHEDEEQHIFPAVLAGCSDPAVRVAVLRLQEEHLLMEKLWARLRTPLAALAAGRKEVPVPALLEAAMRFRELYAGHLQTEDGLVYPLAAELLDESALSAIGQEMGARRGVTGLGPR